MANDTTLTNFGKVVKGYEEGVKDGRKELLEDMITNKEKYIDINSMLLHYQVELGL